MRMSLNSSLDRCGEIAHHFILFAIYHIWYATIFHIRPHASTYVMHVLGGLKHKVCVTCITNCGWTGELVLHAEIACHLGGNVCERTQRFTVDSRARACNMNLVARAWRSKCAHMYCMLWFMVFVFGVPYLYLFRAIVMCGGVFGRWPRPTRPCFESECLLSIAYINRTHKMYQW